MDHSHDHAEVDGPWAGGWAVALVVALLTLALMRGFSDVGLTAMLIVGLVVFGVFGALLGSGGVELTVTEGHGSGGHGAGHDAHGHH
jgi:type IV secretory pathway VirB2 component (pilin)